MGPSLVFEGALNGPVFAQWVRTQLVPTLRPGQIVILDNLNVHKAPEARRAIEAAGCQLRFLPAYSPDFNPIELVFSRLKTHLRTIAARTVDALMTAIGDGLNAVTATDARNCVRHAGYSNQGDLFGLRSRSGEFELGISSTVPNSYIRTPNSSAGLRAPGSHRIRP
ncbi:MAG: transposase [Thermomicrobiales bacterium]|nr:transposase [Thermomicrobiales bacterium]